MDTKPYGGFFKLGDETFTIKSCRATWDQSKPERLSLIVDDDNVAFSVYGMRCRSYRGPESFVEYVFDPDYQDDMFDETRFEIDGVDYSGGGKITCLDFNLEKSLAVFELRLSLVNEWVPKGKRVRGGLRAKLEYNTDNAIR
jgi:hypothetical protein